MKKRIYMDNAATTPMDPRVWEAMMPYLEFSYGNPSSVYSFSRENKAAIKNTRDQASKLINAKPQEIYFTSGGSESINWALKGVCFAHEHEGKHVISVKTEHHAALHALDFLEKRGFEVTYLDVDEFGYVNLNDLEKLIRKDTILVSIMAANNETGTLADLQSIGKICDEKQVLFHTDAVQAIGATELDVRDMHIDLLSASAHKFHGPKGVGFLYVKAGIPIENLIHGGNQERGRRSGTENVAGIVGLGKALDLLNQDSKEKLEKIRFLRNLLIEGLLEIPDTKLNGPKGEHRLPNNVNISFKDIDGESLLLNLDLNSVYASSGSACTSGAIDESHVLNAMGIESDYIKGSLRLSLSQFSSEEEVHQVVDIIKTTVKRLRP
ncbi:MAG: cysteine desulfurase [Clostridium sp.]|nr:cysteine desulfurase [Clostridium sp.]